MTFAELATEIDTKRRSLWKTTIKPQFQKAGFANFIIETITDRLYVSGKDSDGKQLITDRAYGAFDYSEYTVKEKRKKGQKTENVTLRDTGRFYDSYKVQIHDFIFEISASFKTDSGLISDNFMSSYTQKEFENAVTGLTEIEIQEIIQQFISERITPDLYELL